MVVVGLGGFRALTQVPCQDSLQQESIPSATKADDKITAVTSQVDLFFVRLI